jgi:hypothetical protein
MNLNGIAMFPVVAPNPADGIEQGRIPEANG